MELDFSEKNYVILEGDVSERLRDIEDNSVDCVVTSPPYFNLRDYHAEGQIGVEKTPEEYVRRLVGVFREVRRVLKDTGTVWLNIGDSYCNSNGFARASKEYLRKSREDAPANDRGLAALHEAGYKDKDMIGIPWMLAFALRDDGWYLRQDIIWCLSEFTVLYVRDPEGRPRPMSIRELSTKDLSAGYMLWTGEEWTAVEGIRKSDDPREKIELVMGNGEAIGTTLDHRWILADGTEKAAKDVAVGDVLARTALPDEETRYPFKVDRGVLWLAGLYVACGERRRRDGVLFTLKMAQERMLGRIGSVAQACGGKMEYSYEGGSILVTVTSEIVRSWIDRMVWGNSAADKHLYHECWGLSNAELEVIVQGYFQGVGCTGSEPDGVRIPYEAKNHGWRMNMRTLAARLGAFVTMQWVKRSEADRYAVPTMTWHVRRMDDEQNADCTVVKVRDCSAESFYDITVASDRHVYALASGVLTHNCKPNPMPESVSDRCTKAHEYLFLLSKSKKYYFDHEAIEEEATGYDGRKDTMLKGCPKYENADIYAGQRPQSMAARGHERWKFKPVESDPSAGVAAMEAAKGAVHPVKRKRDVWIVPTKSYPGAHFATFPEKLVEPCVLAGCPEGGLVMDIFNGAGTTGMSALRHGRKYVGIELNPEYVRLSKDRLDKEFYDPNWIL